MSNLFGGNSNQTIFGRLDGSLRGMFFAVILIPVAVVLLFWNEGRAVKTATSLQEGAAAAVNIAAGAVVPGNDGKLVHLSGEVMAAEPVRDTVFGVSAKAIRLSRKVEMFQWKEERKSETRSRSDGGTEKRPTFSYVKIWSGELIKSVDFEHPDEHKNPAAMLAGAATAVADHATLGSFRLPPSIIAKMKGDESFSVTAADLQNPGSELQPKAQQVDGNLYFGADPATPEVGDQRVSFRVLKPAIFSIVARQTGDALEPYQTKAGREIELVEKGCVSAGAMFAHAEAENTALAWAARVGGTLLMAFAFGLILRPIATVADVIPLLGKFIGVGIGLAAILLATIVSFFIVAIAWFAVRPLLSGAFIVAAIAWLVIGHRLGSRRQAADQGAADSDPPMPMKSQ